MEYHDKEWGVPVHDEQLLFEFLHWKARKQACRGQRSSPSVTTTARPLRNSIPARVARFTARDVNKLMQNAGIVRNRLKDRIHHQ